MKTYCFANQINGIKHIKIDIPSNLQIIENYKSDRIIIPQRNHIFYGMKKGKDVLIKLIIDKDKDIANNILYSYIYASGKEIGPNLIYSRFCDNAYKIINNSFIYALIDGLDNSQNNKCVGKLIATVIKNNEYVRQMLKNGQNELKTYYVRYVIMDYIQHLDEYIKNHKSHFDKEKCLSMLDVLLRKMEQINANNYWLSIKNIGIQNDKLYILNPHKLVYFDYCTQNRRFNEENIRLELSNMFT